ncbi:MAG: hypothetical protein ACR2QU_08565 [Gammaproteobacteria bacterium]
MMIDLVLEIFGQAVLDQMRDSASSPPGKGGLAASGASRTRNIERDHERLKLVTMALWEIVSEHLNVDEADLKRRIEKLDLLDEKRDGRLRLRQPPKNCEACDRPMLGSAIACPYCGSDNASTQVFP